MYSNQKLPYLPGMVFKDPDQTQHSKGQNFVLCSDTMVEKNTLLISKPKIQIPISISNNLQNEETLRQIQNTLKIKENVNDLYLQKIQNLDVLRFFGFLTQEVPQSPLESECYRFVNIYYYLSDHTLYISEPEIMNSGLMQGKFLGRQRVFHEDGSLLTFKDLRIGQQVYINKHNFTLYDCDECTRIWYLSNGDEQNPSFEPPSNKYYEKRIKEKVKSQDPSLQEYKHYCEVSLGGGHSNKGLKKYLENDRKVLSFDTIWDDKSYGGDINRYTLNYFLSDDTVEVKEIHEQNSGKTSFPLFLKKGKLPKKHIMTYCPGMEKEAEQYYGPRDLILGKKIIIYNREFELINCDPFTKNFYQDNFGIVQKPVEKYLNVLNEEKKKPQIPPHNGYGSELDSIQNCLYLVPKPPKADIAKKFIYNRVILRFTCKMISRLEDDNDRRFLLSYFCDDDTIMIYQMVERNSGLDPGKIMERQKYKNEDTGEFFKPQDIYIGKLQILSADDYTLNFMYQKNQLFPESDPQVIINNLKDKLKHFPNFEEFENYFLEGISQDLMELVTINKLVEIFQKLNFGIQYRELFYIFYLCEKENEEVRLGEILGVIKENVFN